MVQQRDSPIVEGTVVHESSTFVDSSSATTTTLPFRPGRALRPTATVVPPASVATADTVSPLRHGPGMTLRTPASGVPSAAAAIGVNRRRSVSPASRSQQQVSAAWYNQPRFDDAIRDFSAAYVDPAYRAVHDFFTCRPSPNGGLVTPFERAARFRRVAAFAIFVTCCVFILIGVSYRSKTAAETKQSQQQHQLDSARRMLDELDKLRAELVLQRTEVASKIGALEKENALIKSENAALREQMKELLRDAAASSSTKNRGKKDTKPEQQQQKQESSFNFFKSLKNMFPHLRRL
jgi:hypothetical protein